jgi:predicted  nucleic acid-binding Zn-ribbon protein
MARKTQALKDSEDEVARLEIDLSDAMRRIDQLEAQVSDLTTQRGEGYRQAGAFRAEIKEWQQGYIDATARLRDCEQEVIHLKSKRRALEVIAGLSTHRA